MEKVIVLDSNYVEISYIPEYKLIQIIWKGQINTEQYQDAFLRALDFQEETGHVIYNFVSDTRKQGAVSPENRSWFENVVLPRAMRQGLLRGAAVFDGSIFKKFYLNIILQATSKFKLPFKLFNTLEEAYKWFETFEE